MVHPGRVSVGGVASDASEIIESIVPPSSVGPPRTDRPTVQPVPRDNNAMALVHSAASLQRGKVVGIMSSRLSHAKNQLR